MTHYAGETLLDLLPHRPPVLALESLDWEGGDELRARLAVREDSVFFHAGRGIPFWSCLEFFGQAVAALEGLRARRRGLPPPIGYLLGVRACVAGEEYFAAGAQIEVRVGVRLQASDEMALFDGRASAGAQIFECPFSVYKLGDKL